MTDKHREQMYRPFRSSLLSLRREFQRCSRMYLPLYHDLLRGWEIEKQVELSSDAWGLFIAANPEPSEDSDEWWAWDEMLIEGAMGRYSGCPDGLDEFQRLAESSALVVMEMEFEMPGFEVTEATCDAWVKFLHDVAFKQQIPLLRSTFGLWGIDEDTSEDFNKYVSEWESSADGLKYPRHPCHWQLAHSVFVSSIALIDAILDPSSVLLTSDRADNEFVQAFRNRNEELLEATNVRSQVEQSITQPSSHGTEPSSSANIFRRSPSGTWHLRFAFGGPLEEDHFGHKAGFVVCQQLLMSDGKTILNCDLFDPQTRGQFQSGASVIDAQEAIGELTSDDSKGKSRPNWTQGSWQEIADREMVEWAWAECRRLNEEIADAVSKADRNAQSKLREELGKIESFLKGTINEFGKIKVFETPAENHRTRVKKGILDCSNAIKKTMPRLAVFLKQTLKPADGRGRYYSMAGKVLWES